ncbi:MAG TPA: metalloregulator ArsR/SmtB family transcription factor [Tepidisphaeraceae bacterium]|nr:metalloregulator ArsR/SmtB family transcription factor [Tepidisphaeraceae bacterium]
MRKGESTQANALFAAVADATRLRIVNLLSTGELCVCDLVAVLRLPQPKVSRHLAVLRSAGLVEQRIESNWRHYRLAPAASELHHKLLDCLTCCVSCVPQVRSDLQRLERKAACCAPVQLTKSVSRKR